MRFTSISLSSLVLTSALAFPGFGAPEAPTSDVVLQARQDAPVQPPPCVRKPGTTKRETFKRHKAFAHAFIYKPNVSEAFRYIAKDYINHNPYAQNGSDWVWNAISPTWDAQNITVLGTLFISPQGWLNYNDGVSVVVDRYRWEEGCIVEHWDQGEVFPNVTNHELQWTHSGKTE